MPMGVYDRSVRLTPEQLLEHRTALSKRYREANRDVIREKKKQYYAEKRDHIRKQMKQFHAANRERMVEKSKQYYAENRETILGQKKQYNVEKREVLIVKSKRYREENREVLAGKRKQYVEENLEQIRAGQKQYYKDHPEVFRRNGRKRRAIQLNATIGDPAAITAWEETWRSKKTVICHWCRKRIKTADVHVDHVVPLSKGGAHSVENLCVSCETCNLTKKAKLPEAWNAGLSQPLLFV